MSKRALGTAARADALAAALDGAPPPDARTARLVGVVRQLQAFPDGPSPLARASTRAVVVSAAAIAAAELAHPAGTAAAGAGMQVTATSTGTGAAAAAGTAGAAHLLLPVMSGLLAAGIATAGVGVAAHRALPGDPFYGVKRQVEALQLDLARGDTAAAQDRLGFAATRLHEFQALAAPDAGPGTQRRMIGLLGDLRDNIGPATTPLLRGGAPRQQQLWTAAHHTVVTLQGMAGRVPAALNGAVNQTVASVASTQQQAATALHLSPPDGQVPPGGAGTGTSAVPSGQPAAPQRSAPGAPAPETSAPAKQPAPPPVAPRPSAPAPPPVPIPPPTGISPPRILPSGVVPSIGPPLTGVLGGLVTPHR